MFSFFLPDTPDITACDEITQAFSVCIYRLKVTKYCRQEQGYTVFTRGVSEFVSYSYATFLPERTHIFRPPYWSFSIMLAVWIHWIVNWYHAYLFALPLICAAFSKCMLAFRNLVKRRLKSKFGVNLIFSPRMQSCEYVEFRLVECPIFLYNCYALLYWKTVRSLFVYIAQLVCYCSYCSCWPTLINAIFIWECNNIDSTSLNSVPRIELSCT